MRQLRGMTFTVLGIASLGMTGCAATDSSNTCVLNIEQQQLLDETNRMRSQGRFCGGVFSPAVASIAWECRLAAAAELHAADMAKFGFLDHTGSNGLKLLDRLAAQSYSPQAWSENIAMGQQDAVEAVQDWVDSAGHCANLMSATYIHMGAAGATAVNGDRYWVQDFASPF